MSLTFDMQTRRGVNTVLAAIVAAVVILWLAFIIITLGGASFGDFFGQTSSQSEGQRISDVCAQVLQAVDARFCEKQHPGSAGATPPDPTACSAITGLPPATAATSDDFTGNELGCDWTQNIPTADLQIDSQQGTGWIDPAAGGSGDAVVQVGDTQYNCIGGGYIDGDRFCPAIE